MLSMILSTTLAGQGLLLVANRVETEIKDKTLMKFTHKFYAYTVGCFLLGSLWCRAIILVSCGKKSNAMRLVHYIASFWFSGLPLLFASPAPNTPSRRHWNLAQTFLMIRFDHLAHGCATITQPLFLSQADQPPHPPTKKKSPILLARSLEAFYVAKTRALGFSCHCSEA